MSSQTSQSRETAVLGSLVTWLTDRSVPVVLVERPDCLQDHQRTFPLVTTDGLLQIGEPASYWACDVMAAAAPFSHAQIPMELLAALDALAHDHGLKIVVTGDPIPKRMRESHVQADLDRAALDTCNELVLKVRRAAKGQPEGGIALNEGQLSASWSQSDAADVQFVVEAPSVSADLSNQLAATMRSPLLSKATKQAGPARAAGCSTAVLIDALGHRGIRQGTHWLPQHPFTYAEAVTRVMRDEPGSLLDAVLLVDRLGGWHLLTGQFPGFTSPLRQTGSL